MKRRKLEDWWERHQEDVQPERISEELGKVGMRKSEERGGIMRLDPILRLC